MKKILALVLVSVMLMAAALTPAFAQEDELLTAFYGYCDVDMNNPPSDAQIRIIDRYEHGDITYFVATSWIVAGNMENSYVIGDYCAHINGWNSPYELGVYVYVNGEIFDLSGAWEAGFVTDVYPATNLDYISLHNADENRALTHTCMDAFREYRNFTLDKDDYVECEVFGEVNGAVIFRAYIAEKDMCMSDVCSEQRIGGYIFSYGYVIGPEDNPTGLYVLKNGVVYSALKAYEEGRVYIDDLVRLVGAQEDPCNVEAVVAERLGFPSKGSTPDEYEMFPYLYKEKYAHYSYASPYAADAEYILVFAAREPGEPAAPADRIGDYAIGSYEWYDHYRHGMYVYIPESDTLYTLAEAVEAEVEGIENAFLHMGSQGGIIGDADKDGMLTVRDATYIQKIIAGVEVQNPYAYYDNVVNLIRDFDRDDNVNVKDATAIQKAVAGLAYK